MTIAPEHLRTASYADLRADGVSRAGIERALETGGLVRARRDYYVEGTASDALVSAVRVGGRLDCLSLMREFGVFVQEDDQLLHVQVPRARRLLRSPHSRRVRLDGRTHRVRPHWRDDDVAFDSTIACRMRALAQAIECQRPRPAIATVDSALNTGFIAEHELSEVFSLVPLRLRELQRHIDGRAESGPETLARLIARTFGVSVELQVPILGVGRVDIVVDGWIIIECDSRAFHGGWEMQERDRRRDLAAAQRGYVTLRPTARQIFGEPGLLLRALQGLLELGRPDFSTRPLHNYGTALKSPDRSAGARGRHRYLP